MKVLVTGNGKSGSWKIRGEQLATAAGFRVFPRSQTLADAQVLVFVKKYDTELAIQAHMAKVPVVWDIVDAWPQPDGNLWDKATAFAWLTRELSVLRPALVIAATQKMALDLEALGAKAVWVPHHPRTFGTGPAPIRHRIQRVNYEGADHYLGRWASILERSCESRNWDFEINHANYASADLVLGLRQADGYPAANWKSNVKLANAQALGIPFIGSPEQGYLETATPGAEVFVKNKVDLEAAFDTVADPGYRRKAQQAMLESARRVALPKVAALYRGALESLA